MIKKIYDNIILKFPIAVLLVLFTSISVLGYYATKLEIDASAETLLLDNDKDLKFSREVNKRFYNPNFLVVTYSPKGDLLSKESLAELKNISDDLLKIENIESITSILNVPLVQSPIRPIADLVKGVETLSTKKYDLALVKKEFLTSELYSNNLVSPDFKTTAMMLHLKNDTKYFELLEKRNDLLAKKRANTITSEELVLLDKTIIEFKDYRDIVRESEANEIVAIGVLNSCVILLMKSDFILDSFFCVNMT